jgi:CubicO group peptidase (beta-lactamase class C family)
MRGIRQLAMAHARLGVIPSAASNAKRVHWIWVLVIASGLVANACGASPEATAVPTQAEDLYEEPVATGDGWATATLSEVGMTLEPINTLLSLLAQQNSQNINGLLVVKDGKLVLETYYPGEDITINTGLSYTRKDFDRESLHCLASVSKSVTSLVFGVAVDQGKIDDLDEKMFASFPEYADSNDAVRGEITLRHMLSMTTGLSWDEGYPYDDSRNDLNRMYFSLDPVRFMLEKRLDAMPGETFIYNGGVTNLLGEILNRKTGTPLAEYAGEELFAPLGIISYEWLTFPNAPEMAVASSLLYLRPRDMAKIGQMVLQQGVWDGRQVVGAQWVALSTAQAEETSLDTGPAFQTTGHGYQWWRGAFTNASTKAIFAGGWGGQFIFILPELNTVVVLTGSNYGGSDAAVLDLVNRYVLGSILGVPAGSADYGVTLSVPDNPGNLVQIHSGPGEDYAVVGQLEAGSVIAVMGRNPELGLEAMWLQVSPTGWVALQDVGPEGWITGNLANLPVIEGSD